MDTVFVLIFILVCAVTVITDLIRAKHRRNTECWVLLLKGSEETTARLVTKP